jgi:hypothetical protein
MGRAAASETAGGQAAAGPGIREKIDGLAEDWGDLYKVSYHEDRGRPCRAEHADGTVLEEETPAALEEAMFDDDAAREAT